MMKKLLFAEVEFRNIINLEGHTNYVDVCCVNPKVRLCLFHFDNLICHFFKLFKFDILITAASDRQAILWSLEKDQIKEKHVSDFKF